MTCNFGCHPVGCIRLAHVPCHGTECHCTQCVRVSLPSTLVEFTTCRCAQVFPTWFQRVTGGLPMTQPACQVVPQVHCWSDICVLPYRTVERLLLRMHRVGACTVPAQLRFHCGDRSTCIFAVAPSCLHTLNLPQWWHQWSKPKLRLTEHCHLHQCGVCKGTYETPMDTEWLSDMSVRFVCQRSMLCRSPQDSSRCI